MLCWDVTDYGLDDNERIGGVLFTVRNGDQKDSSIVVPYAEKYIVLEGGSAYKKCKDAYKTERHIDVAGSVSLWVWWPEFF